ncbi:MAG: hypothetical protein MJ087_01820 [Lachnospiraceae bacterium]|nr:hypothetical protein [Lachnospiraceae bacterium]
MSKIMYTEVLRTTNIDEYKKKEQEFIVLNDKTKSMMTTNFRKVTFKSDQICAIDYSIVYEDFQNVYIEQKSKDDNVVTKELIPITKEQANSILEGDLQFLADSDDNRLQAFYMKMTTLGLKPAYRKEFTRKTFHQNRFLDIIFDMSMTRKPYEKNDLFAPRKFGFKADYSNLRMSIRHNLVASKSLEQLLAFEKSLMDSTL